jgi:predicted dinucleotide-binding enzyme
VAQHLPGVTLLKAFNAIFATYVAADPRHGEGNQAVFVAGDDELAKAAFAQTISGMGFAPVDVGALREEGRRCRPT